MLVTHKCENCDSVLMTGDIYVCPVNSCEKCDSVSPIDCNSKCRHAHLVDREHLMMMEDMTHVCFWKASPPRWLHPSTKTNVQGVGWLAVPANPLEMVKVALALGLPMVVRSPSWGRCTLPGGRSQLCREPPDRCENHCHCVLDWWGGRC